MVSTMVVIMKYVSC